MFGNNGNGPILSEMEIKFLLSDLTFYDNPPHRPHQDETDTMAEKTEKEEITNEAFAPRKPL